MAKSNKELFLEAVKRTQPRVLLNTQVREDKRPKRKEKIEKREMQRGEF